MKIIMIILFLIIINISESTTNSGSVIKRTVKEMLISGSQHMKLHALAMITQGKINDDLDSSYIKGLSVCSKEDVVAIRLTTAQILCDYYIKNDKKINPEVLDMLNLFSKDENHLIRELINNNDKVLKILEENKF